jgi:hypothetical protein
MEDPRNSMGQHISLITVCYRNEKFLEHLLEKGNDLLRYNYLHEEIMYKAKMSTEGGVDIKNSPDCNGEIFLCRCENELKNSTCLATGGSKQEGKSFFRYAFLYINQETSEKHTEQQILLPFSQQMD